MTPLKPTSADYINSFTFDHMATYSLLRGVAYHTQNKTVQHEYNLLSARQKRGELTSAEAKTFNELGKQISQHLIDSDGQFHPSSVHTHTFKRDSPEVDWLINILTIPAVDIYPWMCWPVYRDAIVFYDDRNQVISNLNICFSCDHMRDGRFTPVYADDKAYDRLKSFFIELGHRVE